MPLAPCGVDHADLTAKQLRGHYAKGCRDEYTRAAKRDEARVTAARKKASGGAGPSTTHAATGMDSDAVAAGQSGMGATIGTPEPAPEPHAKPTPLETILDRAATAALAAVLPKPSSTRQIGTTPALGASRRLQGLVAFGYTPKQLGEACGLTADSIWRMLIAPPFTIPTGTHARIAEVFKRLRNSPRTDTSDTPAGRSAAIAHALAKQHDWAGAYAWEDIDFDKKPTYPARPVVDEGAMLRAVDNATIEPVTTDTLIVGDEKFDRLQGDLKNANGLVVELRRTVAGHASTIDRQRAEIKSLTEQLRDQVDPQQIQRELTAALTELQAAKQTIANTDAFFAQLKYTPATIPTSNSHGRHVDRTRAVDARAM